MSQSREWWHEQFSSFLERSAILLVDRISPRRVRAVFLCGSFSMGEGSVVLETDSPLVLSDVDIVVVLDSLDDLEAWYRRRPELGASCEALLPAVRFAGRVDVGLMLPSDLERLPPRPGVYDMRRMGRVLAGDPSILERIPAFDASAIGGSEALILVENRIAVLLGAYPGEGSSVDTYRFLYAIARVYTDIAVSILSFLGRYRPGYRERAAAVAALATEQPDGSAVRLLAGSLIRGIERWTTYKLDPRQATASIAAAAMQPRVLWAEAASDLVSFRRRAATFGQLPPANLEVPAAAGDIPQREQPGRPYRGNLRLWRSLLGRMPLRDRIALAAGMGSALLIRTPLDVVRAEAVRLLAAYGASDAGRSLAPAPGGFPHRGGTWEEAAARTAAAWSELVFGRTEG